MASEQYLLRRSGTYPLTQQRSVTTPSWAWDELFTGEFRDLVESLDPDSPYLRDLLETRLVIGRALRINGYEAEVTFSAEKAAELKTTYPGVVEGSLSAQWTGIELSHSRAQTPRMLLFKCTDGAKTVGSLGPNWSRSYHLRTLVL